MTTSKQTSRGDNSPNIKIDTLFMQGQQIPQGREVVEMAKIIKYLSNNSSNMSFKSGVDYKKAFNQKLNMYPEINKLIEKQFIDLSVLYRCAYELGWKAENVDEVMKTKISLHLQSRSVDLLSKNNPQSVIEKLCNEIRPAFDNNDFDESAIKYFVLSQFMECNVLPVENV